MAAGGSRADASRSAGVDKATITRWMRDPEFVAGIEAVKPELAEMATEGLEGRVPLALQVLDDALSGKKVSAQMARVALDVIKAAASIKTAGQGEGGTFLGMLRELEAAESSVGSD